MLERIQFLQDAGELGGKDAVIETTPHQAEIWVALGVAKRTRKRVTAKADVATEEVETAVEEEAAVERRSEWSGEGPPPADDEAGNGDDDDDEAGNDDEDEAGSTGELADGDDA